MTASLVMVWPVASFTVSGPLHWCRCGHGEHEHRSWLIECQVDGCICNWYRRYRPRRGRIADGTVEAPWVLDGGLGRRAGAGEEPTPVSELGEPVDSNERIADQDPTGRVADSGESAEVHAPAVPVDDHDVVPVSFPAEDGVGEVDVVTGVGVEPDDTGGFVHER